MHLTNKKIQKTNICGCTAAFCVRRFGNFTRICAANPNINEVTAVMSATAVMAENADGKAQVL